MGKTKTATDRQTVDEPLLRTEGLTKTYGGFTALDSVDFALDENELRGIIGPNGAGKTTFFNLISHLHAPSAGQIWFEDDEITHEPTHKIAKRGIAHLFQTANMFPELSVTENVLGALYANSGIPSPLSRYRDDEKGREQAYEHLERVGLADVAQATVANLSHGDRKQLQFAVGLATDPKLLLLDEPTAGLSAAETTAVKELIEDLKGEVSMIMIEHDMDIVLDLVDKVTVLHQGRIFFEGKPEAISDSEDINRIYFGRE